MIFNDILDEVNIQYVDYDFHKSYYKFFVKQGNRSKIFDWHYKNAITKNGRKIIANKYIPAISSVMNHPLDRIKGRYDLGENELIDLLSKALEKIKNEHNFQPNGYRILQKSTGVIIPTLLHANTDTYNNGIVMIDGEYSAPPNFKEKPDYFLEVRTVLTPEMYGSDVIKVYSNKAADTIGVIKNHIDILLEKKYKSFELIII